MGKGSFDLKANVLRAASRHHHSAFHMDLRLRTAQRARAIVDLLSGIRHRARQHLRRDLARCADLRGELVIARIIAFHLDVVDDDVLFLHCAICITPYMAVRRPVICAHVIRIEACVAGGRIGLQPHIIRRAIDRDESRPVRRIVEHVFDARPACRIHMFRLVVRAIQSKNIAANRELTLLDLARTLIGDGVRHCGSGVGKRVVAMRVA